LKGEPDNFEASIGKPPRVSAAAIFAVVVLCSAERLSAVEVDLSKLPPPSANKIDFLRDIQPILETSCLRCHNAEKAKSGFRLDNRPSALKGGDHGVDILPGNSAKSPLIHYVANLVEDLQMPPSGKGPQLTPAQVGLLRAWIDQGVAWDTGAPASAPEISISPTVGATGVSGDAKKYREHYWQPEGANGGLEQFDWYQKPNADDRVLLTGHALRDDYKIDLRADRAEVGFIHAGWEQYRKYFDDTGGYYQPFTPSSFTLDRDLHLDIGKAWVDFGLTLPHWPRLVLGYEYDYRQGGEAETDWGAHQPPGGVARSILPASQQINEGVHAIKFDLDHELKGVTIEDRFRGEFYDLNTQRTNFSPGPLAGGATAPLGYYAENVNESTHYFQGANTFRLERQLTDWFLGSAGYLCSKLNADSAFDRTTMPLPGNSLPSLQLLVPQITLERESQVVNANGQFGPFDGLNFSGGVQSEWTRQHGLGAGSLDSLAPTTIFDPAVLGSDYDQTLIAESVAVRYAKIPFTVLFAEARLEEQTIGQSEQFALGFPSGVVNKDDISFAQQTDFSSLLTDFRAGFNTSPWQSISFSAHFRRSDDDSHYHNGRLQIPIGILGTGYPGFITARDLLTDEIEAKLVWHPRSFFKTTLTYQYRTTDSRVGTLAVGALPPTVNLLAGQQVSDTYSINTAINPTRRWVLSTKFSYQPTTTVTYDGTSTAVVPYRGNIYSVIADGTYVLSVTTDLSAGYAFSAADYGQNDAATSLPLGIQYQQHSLQVGVTRRFGKDVSAKLQYRFNYYAEPSGGGATDYRAHTIFATLTYKFH
jgi:hypothetical protein